ncbi:MAG: hypothetical protein SNJ67_00670 [Chloracidobacterium sp.]|uniref:Uncharacterized protein n=1 Tax=Chloracidobacterium validum TaxID=2821543 RepID=A0ABX8B5Y7_9BACT|nr:hypothetical protein [Chloracidobacterium validum]QUW02382.1 hypothetical protein J8C06_08440 [Chloracidobacterium validum]
MQRSTLWFNRGQVRRLLGLWLWMVVLGGLSWGDDLGNTGALLPDGLSEVERQSLQKKTNPKDHVEDCLRIGTNRLALAADAVKRENFDAAAQALRGYANLLDYSHGYTQQIAKPKVRNQMYRKLEITLRQHLPLLEWLSNEMPDCHESCVRHALSRAKTIRRESLNAFFGDGFLKASTETTTE